MNANLWRFTAKASDKSWGVYLSDIRVATISTKATNQQEMAELMAASPDMQSEIQRLQAENSALRHGLQVLINSCDTGMRNNGEQIGVRTPEKVAVIFARAALNRSF